MILDCTLRDGGYYVDWDFDRNIVNKYLSSLASTKVDIIEVGFRFLPTPKFLGAFAYSSDEYLRTLTLPSDILIAVMINASELINHENGIREGIVKLFANKTESPVDIVRVAIDAKRAGLCKRS